MSPAFWVFAVLLGIALLFLFQQQRKINRRAALRAASLTSAQIAALEHNVPFYKRLPHELQVELQGRIRVFVDEKNFEGCNGLEVTDEIRITIAAQACILLLNRKGRTYPELVTVLVYPSPYQDQSMEGEGSTRLGESWVSGTVVLAWDHVLRGAKPMNDARNVVFHEFAHQLDQEDKAADGTPKLGPNVSYAQWGEVLGREYLALRESVDRGQKAFLDSYGATNEAEFFAVVTEFFFEKPDQLGRKHPELFEAFKAFYRQDPRDYD